MSAIAGVVCWNDGTRPAPACEAILARLNALGPHGSRRRIHDNACFGRALYALLPEDEYDRQPLIGASGRFLMAADIRIDNRNEVGTELALGGHSLDAMSDSDLLLAAWERWQMDCLDRLLGDLAFAVWDATRQLLTLARSASSLKPLFYCDAPGIAAFATTPQALLAFDGVRRQPDLNEAAGMAAGVPGRGSATVFAGIRAVRHGHAVEITGAAKREFCHWDLDSVERSRLPLAQAAEAMRVELDRAVSAQLRRRTGEVGCQLSSGRDSSAILASSALIQAGRREKLIALTGAPNAAFHGPQTPGRLSDESGLAALTARTYGNVEHFVCRSAPLNIAADLGVLAHIHFRPLTHPSSLHWTTAVDDEARRQAASVMLIGSAGNFSISASGPNHLVDLLSARRPHIWLRHALKAGGWSTSGWRSVGSVSVGPFLPGQIYGGLLKIAGRTGNSVLDAPLLRQPFREHAERMLREEFGDRRQPRDYLQFRRDMLFLRDNADKMSLALSGLDVRDPASDRRLIELCLSFPPEHLISAGNAPSPVYAAAFGDRIPREVLHNPCRGLQGADWFMLFNRAELRQCLERSRGNRAVAELLDLEAIGQLVESWPERGSADWPKAALYRYQLLPALAVAAFLAENFPD